MNPGLSTLTSSRCSCRDALDDRRDRIADDRHLRADRIDVTFCRTTTSPRSNRPRLRRHHDLQRERRVAVPSLQEHLSRQGVRVGSRTGTRRITVPTCEPMLSRSCATSPAGNDNVNPLTAALPSRLAQVDRERGTRPGHRVADTRLQRWREAAQPRRAIDAEAGRQRHVMAGPRGRPWSVTREAAARRGRRRRADGLEPQRAMLSTGTCGLSVNVAVSRPLCSEALGDPASLTDAALVAAEHEARCNLLTRLGIKRVLRSKVDATLELLVEQRRPCRRRGDLRSERTGRRLGVRGGPAGRRSTLPGRRPSPG